MKSTFLCIVTLITCSGCVIGDLEFYPDYQRPEVSEEEWAKDPPLNPEIQTYLEEERLPLYKQEPPGYPPYPDLNKGNELDLAWPNVIAQTLLKNQNLARRITEITRKFEETGKKPQYYFKTHGLLRDEENRLNNIYNTLEDRTSDFVPRFKPNFHILDDVRLHLDNTPNSEYSLPSDNDGSNNRKFPTAREEERNALIEEHLSDENVQDSRTTKNGGDDPDEFAYPPSDPRYFEDAPISEVKSPKTVRENADSQDNENSIQIQNREDDGFTVFGRGPFDGRRTDSDTLEVVAIKPHPADDTTGVYIIAIVAGISAAATVGLIAFGIGWYNLQKHVKNASDVEYPAYGVTGPNKDISPSGDRRLAQSAQMYHYQHQKQQIIAMERAAASERHGSVSEADSDEENEEGDYTVYECPGLAPTGEMEVKNPLFQDDPTPAQTPALKTTEEEIQKK